MSLNGISGKSRAVVPATLLFLAACGGGSSSTGPAPSQPPPPPPPPPADLGTSPATCAGGVADDFSCSGIDLKSRVPLAAMQGTAGNDVWGWADLLTGREYALMGMTNGTAFVDVTDPQNPLFLGILPTETTPSTWRDIKVFKNHAYVVADGSGAHGMQVFDLTRLRNVSAPGTFSADVRYGDFDNAHNLAINETTGFAYAVGTNTCNEGLHIVDITTPNNPVFAGCHTDFEVHDTQCVVYIGPDADYNGAEICANSAVDRVELVDVSNKSTKSISAWPRGPTSSTYRISMRRALSRHTKDRPPPRITTSTCSATACSRPTTRPACGSSSSAISPAAK